jgi:hypothetical protein
MAESGPDSYFRQPVAARITTTGKDCIVSNEIHTEKKPRLLDPKANLKALVRILVILMLFVVAIWLFIRLTAGEKAANKVTSTILQRPMELKNSVESVPASSMKGIVLKLPYSGTLAIEATVMKGNELDIYVVEPSQIENVKAKKQFSYLQGFEATKTKNYRRSSRLPKGDYYFVVVDTTLGILSASSSDIQILAKLEP